MVLSEQITSGKSLMKITKKQWAKDGALWYTGSNSRQRVPEVRQVTKVGQDTQATQDTKVSQVPQARQVTEVGQDTQVSQDT